MRYPSLRTCIAILTVIFFARPSFAATPPNIPSSNQPGAEASRFQQQAESERARLEKKKPKKPEIEIQEKEKKPVEKGPSFLLKEVIISGSTVFKAEEFSKVYAPYLNKEVGFQDVNNIVNAVEGMYKKKGYLTTNVYLPEQDVVGGKVQINILEGKMGDVKVEGNKWFSSKLIKEYFHSKKNELLNIFTLQKDLLRLNQNSDLEIKSVISAGSEPGSSDIVLKAKEKFPYHAGGAFNNQGTLLTGKLNTSISFRSTNLSGHSDSLFVNTSMAGLAQGNFASYAMPIDTYGTKVGVDISVFNSMLGKEFKVFDIASNSQVYTPKIMSEMYLSDDFQASSEAGFDIKSIKKWILGEKATDDELRMPWFGFDFSLIDSLFGGGQTIFSPKFDFSTSHFLGASSENHTAASRENTGGFFFKYEQTLRRIQRTPFDSYVSARIQFQNATHTLPSSEAMSLGGANSIRGYPEGDYAADYGAILNLDWVLPMPFIPKDYKLPYSETPLRHQFEPVVFMDMGGGRLKRTQTGERETKFLMGLGGGLKVHINNNIFLNLYWAERVGDRPTGNQAPSNFNISFQGEI